MDRCMQVGLLSGMQALADQSNFIFSPLSLRAGLALLAAGAHGATLRQLLDFLGCEDAGHLDAATARLHAGLRAWPQVSFAAGVFVDRSLSLAPAFASAAASAHAAVARSVDFVNDPAAAAAEVNGFVEQATAGRIRDLVSADAFGGGGDVGAMPTAVVLANGVHFKATWARRFEPEATVYDYFDCGDDRFTPFRVPFLSDPGEHYAEAFDDGFKVLQLFYKMTGPDGRLHRDAPCFCMLLFLPDDPQDGLAALLRLAAADPEFVMRCVPRREQEVSPCMVPKFSSIMPLGGEEEERLYVSALGMACAVEVDEEGTTAVASTCVCYSPTDAVYRSPPPPPPVSFVADHPFMFAIVEYDKGEVLFIGHVMDPSKEA
ncbi:hypothetical protein EJB05_22656, partial [Eragrostis curvula]